MLGYPVPSITTATRDWQPYALMVLSGLLGGNNSARMIDDLVRGRSLASGLSTSYSPYHLYSTLFTIDAVPAKGVPLSTLKATILQWFTDLPTHPFTPEDMLRVKAQLIASSIFEQDGLMGQAFKAGFPLMMNQPWLDHHAWSERIGSVTLDQVNQMVKMVLQPNQLTALSLRPLASIKEVS
jgi:zinc protease